MVLKKVREILEIYPRVKGIQVMNDMGSYLFSQYQGRWIPDSPARRRSIVSSLSTWRAFSNSSPVEGITAAISTFYATDKKISLYVFGDEFSGNRFQPVIDAIDRINRVGRDGSRRVRIHAVGEPDHALTFEPLQLVDRVPAAVPPQVAGVELHWFAGVRLPLVQLVGMTLRLRHRPAVLAGQRAAAADGEDHAAQPRVRRTEGFDPVEDGLAVDGLAGVLGLLGYRKRGGKP